MNAAQIHLALNHIPLFLSAIGGIILLWGFIRKNESFTWLSKLLLVAGALFTIPVFFTGEGTEELVEHIPGVTEGAIEKHENMAKIALTVIAATGVVALAGLFLRKKETVSRIVMILLLVLSLASFGTMAQTAHLGGMVHHPELQPGFTGVENEENENGQKKDEGDTDQKEMKESQQDTKDNPNRADKPRKDDDDD
ncbi:MAG: hypothetical protein ACO25B_05450 [Chitinophagaceae bacterium]